ncbi:MAG TPA: winged helix-turn-helix domain-containing protein [Terriglobia bacterium]|nr:winged helix-turn-helix domain-containing protein [Terriglobia bacterium]
MRPSRSLPEGSVERLEQALRGARSKAEFQRVQCVWLRVAPGLNANQVAQALRWRPTSVRRLQAQFLRQGEGFWERPERGGRRHQNLTREAEAHLLQSFLLPAEQGGLREVSRVKQAYEQAVGHVVPKSTVYRMLARHGWRKLAPRPRHPQADDARQQADGPGRGRCRRRSSKVCASCAWQ